jgi:hypothetical protein
MLIQQLLLGVNDATISVAGEPLVDDREAGPKRITRPDRSRGCNAPFRARGGEVGYRRGAVNSQRCPAYAPRSATISVAFWTTARACGSGSVGELGRTFGCAVQRAQEQTGVFAKHFPERCPWTPEQILDRDFLPGD